MSFIGWKKHKKRERDSFQLAKNLFVIISVSGTKITCHYILLDQKLQRQMMEHVYLFACCFFF